METMETASNPTRPSGRERLTRRDLFERFGWAGLTALLVASVPGLLRFLRPAAGRGGGALVDVGAPRDFETTLVATRWVARHGLWVVNRDGRLFALEARCTHLGCTPRWEPDLGVFRCPCHGSRFSPEGEVLTGPATRPLARFALHVEQDQVRVDRSRRAPLERAERDDRFWIPL